MGEAKRRKVLDPNFGKMGQKTIKTKKPKITHEPHTLEQTYKADLINMVELFYYDPETHTVHTSFSPHAYQTGKMIDFSHASMLDMFNHKKGYYYANHIDRTGNYAGENFKDALEFMKVRGYIKNVVKIGDKDDKVLKTKDESYYKSQLKKYYCPGLIIYYRNHLKTLNIKPSQDLKDYPEDCDCEYFRIFVDFSKEHNEFFINPMKVVAFEFGYDINNKDEYNKILRHLWIVLGFEASRMM